MVRHHHIVVKFVVDTFIVAKGHHNDCCYFRYSQVERTVACFIKKPVHGSEGCARGEFGWKVAVFGKAAGETPSDEDRQANGVNVWKPTRMGYVHNKMVAAKPGYSQALRQGRLQIARSFKSCPTWLANSGLYST